MQEKTKRITGSVGFMPVWWKAEMGITFPNPWKTDIDQLVEIEMECERRLHERYPDLPLGSENPVGVYPVLNPDGRIVCAMAFGLPEPAWNEDEGMFWFDRNRCPLAWVETPQDVKKINVPDWEAQPFVCMALEKANQAESRRTYSLPKEKPSIWEMTFPRTGKTCRFSVFFSFIDVGNFLCGTEKFLTMLAGEPDTAHALLDKCFQLSTSYTEFMHRIFGIEKVEGLSSFGGDFSCLLSPAQYKEYAMAFDMKLVDRYGRLPCNLHSCGPSKHLYEVWATYPNLSDIVVMQTRGIPGELRKLRKLMPHTFLQITLHPPQFDFERESPEKVRRTVLQCAQDAEYRDISLSVFVVQPGPKVDENIRAFYSALDEVNSG